MNRKRRSTFARQKAPHEALKHFQTHRLNRGSGAGRQRAVEQHLDPKFSGGIFGQSFRELVERGVI